MQKSTTPLFGYVYIIEANDLYKIGCATDIDRRLAQLRTAAPYLREVLCIPCVAYREIEKYLHFMFAHKREAGEWFSLQLSDLSLIAEIDWSAFPGEIHARTGLAELYERIMVQVRALSSTERESLRTGLLRRNEALRSFPFGPLQG